MAPRWVLTTLLCLREYSAPPDKQYVSIGSLNRNGVAMGEVIEIIGREGHPDLNLHTNENYYETDCSRRLSLLRIRHLGSSLRLGSEQRFHRSNLARVA